MFVPALQGLIHKILPQVELPIRENATKIDLNVEWGDGETSRIQNVLFDNIDTGTGNVAIIQSGKISHYENGTIQGSSIDLNYGGFINKTNGDTIFINKTGRYSSPGPLPTTVTIKITGTCLNDLGRCAFGYGEQSLEGQEFLKEINGDIKDLSTGVTDFDRFFEKAFFNCRGLTIATITSTIATMNKKANDFLSHCFFGQNINISALPSSVLHADFYLHGTFKGCHELYVEVTVVNSNAISDSLGIPALPSQVEYASYFLEETFDDCIRLKYTPLIPAPPDTFGIPPLSRYFNINDIPIDPNDPSKIFYMGEFATDPTSGSIKNGFYTVIEGVPFTTTKEQDIIDIVDKKYETRTIQKAPVEMWKPDFYYDMGSKIYRKEQTNVTGIYELVCYYAIRGVQQYDFSITLVDFELDKETFADVKNQPWMFPWPDSYIGLSTLQLYPDYNSMWGGLDSNNDGNLQAIDNLGIQCHPDQAPFSPLYSSILTKQGSAITIGIIQVIVSTKNSGISGILQEKVIKLLHPENVPAKQLEALRLSPSNHLTSSVIGGIVKFTVSRFSQFSKAVAKQASNVVIGALSIVAFIVPSTIINLAALSEIVANENPVPPPTTIYPFSIIVYCLS
ncbi:MAG: hypothetical protein EZS28_030277 [Streblomastix strix]|uniref:Uncharacterized protein n=1 Tax=Streblomastix strix TaxID=222440 RepID=A0A5J4UU89_9EUKA|nr:MAG: hypothetical protein EZS28_030277 [Streblomastix strix]